VLKHIEALMRRGDLEQVEIGKARPWHLTEQGYKRAKKKHMDLEKAEKKRRMKRGRKCE
jgi:hypothetical protein